MKDGVLPGNAAGSSNGRTHASGAWYLGSSPSPAALLRSGMVLNIISNGVKFLVPQHAYAKSGD